MILRIQYFLLALLLSNCSQPSQKSTAWCDQPLRSAFSEFKEIPTGQSWFKVYEVGTGVYAIAEPFNFQEVISYLIVGSEKNILFDTGMGMGKISDVVQKLSTLPVIVVNSHTHYDHIGGNNEFDTILAVDTSYTHRYAATGWTHDQVRQEVQPMAFCMDKLPGLDTASYAVKAYQDKIKGYLADGTTISLGNRTLEVLRVPGHTPDCIALLDRANGYLWTGDMYYEATIWLFFEGTDLNAYERSIARFASHASSLTRVFPAHNTPTADPAHLLELRDAFAKIRSGEVQGTENKSSKHPGDLGAITFQFEHFSFLIRRDRLN